MINHGNNRQTVLRTKDLEAFLAMLAELKQHKPFDLYGYCVLDSYFPGAWSIELAAQPWLL